jgi:hypothetical protein
MQCYAIFFPNHHLVSEHIITISSMLISTSFKYVRHFNITFHMPYLI